MDFVRGVLGILSQANPNVAASLVTAVVALFGYGITAAVAVTGYVYTQRRTQERAIADAHRPLKIKVYDHFLLIVRFIQYAVTEEGKTKKRTQQENKDLTDHYREFTRGLIEWGSPAVIKEYMAFRKEVKPGGSSALLLAMDNVLRAIRRDLGLSNRGLRRGALLALLVKDPESWLRDPTLQREKENSSSGE